MSRFLERLKQAFQDKEYRHSYADEFLNAYIATQIKTLREHHRPPWRQEDLAREAGMQQPVICRLEDVNYGSWSINTLRKLARAFDLRLKVSFESFGSLVPEFESFSTQSLMRASFSDDLIFREDQEQIANRSPASAITAMIFTQSMSPESSCLRRQAETGARRFISDKEIVPHRPPTPYLGTALTSLGRGAYGSHERSQSQVPLAM